MACDSGRLNHKHFAIADSDITPQSYSDADKETQAHADTNAEEDRNADTNAEAHTDTNTDTHIYRRGAAGANANASAAATAEHCPFSGSDQREWKYSRYATNGYLYGKDQY